MIMRAKGSNMILGDFGLRQSTSLPQLLPLPHLLPHLGITHLDQLVYSFHVFTLEDIEADFRTPPPPMIFT